MKPEYERRASFQVSVTLLREMFDFPADVVVVGADYIPTYDVVVFHLKGSNKGLYFCGEGATAPNISDFEGRK